MRGKYNNVIAGGNTPDNPALSFLDKLKIDNPIVLELPSCSLELVKLKYKAPKIAIITNLYRNHLNRHGTIKNYALAKSHIFQNQKDTDYLILNYDNKWTKFFLSLKPVSQVYFTSHNPLPKEKNGVFNKNNKIYFQENKKKKLIFNVRNFSKHWGEHNVDNLMAAILASKLFGLTFSQIKKRINSLPQVKFRQEKVFQSKKLLVINDSSATSPDATISALQRFAHQKDTNLILITGGTDKNLKYDELAKKIKKDILPKNLVILNGSASKKLVKELNKIKYSNSYFVFESLKECFYYSLYQRKQKRRIIVLFSPSAASFEKFKNEFDRAEQFNKLIKTIN